MRAIRFVTFASLLILTPLYAQEPPAEPPAAAEQTGPLKEKDIPVIDQTPLDWEIGPDAIVVKGIGILAGSSADPEKWTGYAQYSVNGEYGDGGKNRIADVSVNPGFTRAWLIKDPEDFGCEDQAFQNTTPGGSASAYAEVRSRYSDIDKSDAVDYESAVLGGVGVKLRLLPAALIRWTRITGTDTDAPTLSATYYNAFTNENPDPDTTVDQIQVALRAEIPLPFTLKRSDLKTFLQKRDEYFHQAICGDNPDFEAVPTRPQFPFSLSVELKASRPTTGDSKKTDFLADVAFKWMQPNSKVGLSVRYRTGEDLGFEYDREYLAGVLLRLFEPASGQ